MTGNYNLLEEDWIPVLYHDGTYTRVGIRKALNDAARIRQIAASNPMDRHAILRFLIAVLYWCKGNPPENARDTVRDPFPPEWFPKLDGNQHYFNLFGAGQRFFQNPAYSTTKPEHTVNYLIHEVPSGNNFWHFRHVTDRSDGLCCACCAVGLLRLPVFATSGGRGMSAETGKSPGINGKPPLYVVRVGQSLAETMRLNWFTTYDDLGTPTWETPNVSLPEEGQVPLLNGMTWIPRSIWLTEPKGPDSSCVACGRIELLIRECVFDGKGSSKAEKRTWCDPHVVYAESAKGVTSPMPTSNALDNSDAAAGHWTAHVTAALKSHGATSGDAAWIVSFATVQNDKYLEAFEHTIPWSQSPDQIQQILDTIERWRKQKQKIVQRASPPREATFRRKHVEIPALIDGIRPDTERRAGDRVVGATGAVEEAFTDAANEYRPLMGVIAKSLSPGVTTRAIKRRRQISNAIPDVLPGAPTTTKTRAKKGGKR